eukprot:CAMPEP_0203821650 /NCGR_PEP_ID=MMETSP0115-20131106/43783_1 /ASSEMBLY_ACC=CAM_ASM_000227 /TAXON_ID=33651 /ORGANISM="Bicosoecid sp, Strain ms1" /LENGTH=211 /DNA_ID=CAMNT_0050730677 /DNA_START=61 /DNA_END=692 /DNA_ORIENTATION=-
MEGAEAVAVSREAEGGLRLAGSSGSISDAAFTEVARGAFGVLARAAGITEDGVLGSEALSGVSKADAKALYSALCTYIVEAVRAESSAEAVGTGLVDLGLSAARAKTVVSLYRDARARLADLLADTGVSLGKVVDVEWRLDYQVQSSGVGKTHKPQYFIKLKTATPTGELKDVEFTATLQQLQDMLTRLKEASGAVEGMVGVDDGGSSSGG